LHCPFCRGAETRVVDSRDTENGQAIRRRRECSACGQRYTTFERIEGVPLVVIKRDGRREAFDRAKVVSGIAKACKNRPVSDEAMRAICDAIEDVAREAGGAITSEGLGQQVLAGLKELDEVAFVRFASVYQEFSDVSEFGRVIAELETEGTVGGQG
jgi:transcriptional repressor NrdR